MITKRQRVQTYAVKLMCDCGGELIYDGTILPTYPAQYRHVCNKCGNIELIFDASYPKIEYEDEDDGDDLR